MAVRASQVETAGARTRLLLLLLPLAAFLFAFLVLPMLGLLRTSFLPGERSFGATGFSFEQYVKFLGDGYYLGVLAETIGFGLAAAFVSLVLGFPVGYSLARLPPSKRRWRLIIVILPLTLSLVVVVFGWLVLLGRNGLVNSVLVGLGRADGKLGDWVLAGEPVGAMSDIPSPRSGAEARAAQESDPGRSLYYELRRDSRPVDPQPWLASVEDRHDERGGERKVSQ